MVNWEIQKHGQFGTVLVLEPLRGLIRTMGPNGRNAIITGAASGLGRAIALRLARDGWNIALCDVNDPGSEETLKLVRAAGGDGQVEHLDVTSPDAWQALCDRLVASWQNLDLLVNNAGVTGIGEVGTFPLTDWHWLLGINLWNGIHGCHTFVPWLKRNPHCAHIINTASMAAFDSAPGTAAYNISKAGILALSETLYGELLPHRVGVTVICPSFFKSNLLDDARFANDRWRTMFQQAMGQSAMTADYVADRAIRAMQRKQLYVLLPARSRFNWYLKRLSPQSYLRGVAKYVQAQIDQTG